jgi:beta-lactamase class C
MHFSFKNLLLKLCLTGITTFITLQAFSATSNTQEPLNIFVETQMKNLMQQEKIPGTVVLIYHEGKMRSYTFGVEDLKTQKPVTLNTIFELGSVTKTFVTLLLAEQVQSGKVTLAEHLPEKFGSADQISLLQLATHTGSLPFNAPGIPYNAEASKQKALFQFLQSWQPPYPIGATWNYSNLGFGLLGMDLADINQTSLDKLLKKEVLIPLHMTHSGLDLSSNTENKSSGYTKAGNLSTSNNHAGILSAGWAMKSSGEDMKSYLRATAGDAGTPSDISEAIKLSQTAYISSFNTPTKLGLGWVITPLDALNTEMLNQIEKKHDFSAKPIQLIKAPAYSPNSLIGKTGATDGFRSYIGVIPASHDGVVILVNKYTQDALAVRETALKILFQSAGIHPKKSLEDPEILRKSNSFFF